MPRRDISLLIGAAALLPLIFLFVVLGWLPLVNGVVIVGFAISAYGYSRTSSKSWLHQLLWLTAFLVGVFIATYRPPEFLYPLVVSEPFLHSGGEAFQLYLNVAKALAGWILVVLLLPRCALGPPPLIQRSAWQWGFVALVVATIILFAKVLLGLAWIPKLPAPTVIFIIVNIAVTCVAEEAFFRLLLQRHLASLFECRVLQLSVPVAVTALVFAVTHHLAMDALFAVYLAAGAGYALVYSLTERFVAAVAVHAGVNIAHFLLLPYPLPVI